MPNGFPAEASNVNIVTTTPTTVLSNIVSAFDDIDQPDALRGNVISPMSASCTIRGSYNITPGAGTTSVTTKVFNGAGVQIGPLYQTAVTAGANSTIAFAVRDLSPRGTATYSVQVTCNAATANSTVNDILASADMQG